MTPETFDKLKPDSQEQNLNLCQKDIKAIHNAFNILQEQFAHPPSIVSLSREVGVNRNKLLAGFKSLFGITIQAHCLRKRMEVGKDLLLSSDQPSARRRPGSEWPRSQAKAWPSRTGL